MSRRKNNVAKKEVKTATQAKPVTAASKTEAKVEIAAKEETVEVKKEEPVKKEESVKVEENTVQTETNAEADAPKKRGRKPLTEKAVVAVKKSAKKVEKEVVEEVFFEYNGEQFLSNTLVERIKEAWKNDGHRIGSIKTLRVYVDVVERKAYYVINDKSEGKFVSF